MSKNPTTLSLNKLEDLLSRHNYCIASVYYDNIEKTVAFLEIRTPRVQKTFIIAVPKKYKMKCDSNTHKTFDISFAPSLTTSEGALHQIEYLKEIKGPLLECDLVSISSSLLSICKNNDVTYVYTFGDASGGDASDAGDDDIAEEKDDVVDTVDKLVKDAKKLGKIIDPSEKVLEIGSDADADAEEKDGSADAEEKEEKEGNGKDAKENDEDSEDVADETLPEEETPIELEFDDTPLPAAPSIDKDENSESIEEVPIRPQPKAASLKKRVDNAFPEGIEDADLAIGIIYYAIDLDVFYKKVATGVNSKQQTLENEILGIYDALDDNESDMRASKLDEIAEVAAKIAQQTKSDVEVFKKEEMSLKAQILKLSMVLDQTENLRARIAKAPAKFVETKPEIDRLYNQTKTTLREINIELLKNRDTVDDLLGRVQISLEEILEF